MSFGRRTRDSDSVESSELPAIYSLRQQMALPETEAACQPALTYTVELGEIRRKANTRALARFLVNTMQGLVVLNKGKIGKKTCHDVISVAMAALAA